MRLPLRLAVVLLRGVAAIFVLGSCLFACGQQPAGSFSRSAAALHYDTPGIRLEGILTERKVFGPPGYGETPKIDSRQCILILKLPQPISVEPVSGAETSGSANLDAVKEVREIQLLLGRGLTAHAKPLLGTQVIATGTLEEGLTASQYTRVWMDTGALVKR